MSYAQTEERPVQNHYEQAQKPVRPVYRNVQRLPHGDGEKLNDRQKDRNRCEVRIVYEIGRDTSYNATIGMSSWSAGLSESRSELPGTCRDAKVCPVYHYFRRWWRIIASTSTDNGGNGHVCKIKITATLTV